MSRLQIQFAINTSRYAWILLGVLLALLITHVTLYAYNYTASELPWLLLQLFDLDEEYNLPTWFSSFLLFNNAFVLFVIAQADTSKFQLHWRILAAGFLLLSVDEVAGMHETINTAFEINWAIPGGIVALLTGVAFIPFLLALPRRRAALYLVSGLVFVSGAIIIELLSEDMDSDSLRYMLAVAVEEGCEMLGAWLFLAENLRLLSTRAQSNAAMPG